MLQTTTTRAGLTYRAWRYRLKLDRQEIGWLRRVLRPGDMAVDVGAHKGAYTYWMRRSVGAEGRVLAFEPQPALAAYLEEAVSAFRWKNVTVENLGLSSAPGHLKLFVPGEGPSPGATLVEAGAEPGATPLVVAVDTLDAYLERLGLHHPVRLIKCDAEGHELEVFRGSERTLGESRPMLLFECEARHDPDRPISRVFAFLEERAYRGSFYWRGSRMPMTAFRPEVHQMVGRRPYINNFLFVPEEASPLR